MNLYGYMFQKNTDIKKNFSEQNCFNINETFFCYNLKNSDVSEIWYAHWIHGSLRQWVDDCEFFSIPLCRSEEVFQQQILSHHFDRKRRNGSVFDASKNCMLVEVNIHAVRFNVFKICHLHMLVSTSYRPKLESTSLWTLLGWLGAVGICTTWLSWNFQFYWSIRIQSASGVSWELFDL